MMMFWTLSPFAAFTGLMLLAPSAIALLAAAAMCALVIAVDLWSGRSLKVLHLSAALLFLALGGYVMVLDRELGNIAVRTAVDSGLLLIALGSLALGRPFTTQYALENVTPEIAATHVFHRVNVVLTSMWAGAFVLMILADLAAIYLPSLPLWSCVAIAFFARNGALLLTQWYAARPRGMIPSALPMQEIAR